MSALVLAACIGWVIALWHVGGAGEWIGWRVYRWAMSPPHLTVHHGSWDPFIPLELHWSSRP